MTLTRIASSPPARVRPAQGSIDATLARLADEPWWPTIRQLPAIAATLRGQIVCLGHFLGWLDAHHLAVADCTEERLSAYDRSVERFRSPDAYRRTARRFVELAVVWQACQPRRPSAGVGVASVRSAVGL